MLKKVILITGSNGEIGHSLINALNKKNICNIIAIDLEQPKDSFMIEKFISGSILDKNLLSRVNKEYEILRIYHLAAILSTKAQKNPKLANDVNINGTINLLELASLQSKKQNKKIPFFFPSSIAVYNTIKSKKIKINEYEYCENPITEYGKAKLKCENISQKYNGVDFRCIRFPGIISGTSVPTGGTSDFAPEMIHYAAQNKEYNCFIDKNRKIPFIVMPDAINAIFKIMNIEEKNLNHLVYNITSFSPSVNDFYIKTKYFFSDFNMKYQIDNNRQNIVDSWPDEIDDNNAKKDWGWSPEFNFELAYLHYLIPKIKIKYTL